MRDILAADFVEESIVYALGIDNLRSFLETCFLGQTYYLTKAGSDEHRHLWTFDLSDPDS